MAPAHILKVINKTKGLLIRPMAIISNDKANDINPVAPKALCASWVEYKNEVNKITLIPIRNVIPNQPNISSLFIPTIKSTIEVVFVAIPVKL